MPNIFDRIHAALREPEPPDRKGNILSWCPFHPDGEGKPPHRKSLSVHPEKGFRCLACGEQGSLRKLASKLGLEGKLPRIVATYDYQDGEGNLLYQVVRRKDASGGKDFRQRRPNGKGGWTWNLGDAPRVLYRLPALKEKALDVVFIVEGEKDVDRLEAAGFLATTNPMGAGNWRGEYSQELQGRDVIIIPDEDDVGKMHAREVAASLLGVARSIKVVELPGLRPKEDVSDWFDGAGDAEQLRAIVGGAETHRVEKASALRIVDYAPEEITRPLCIAGGHAYAASWVTVEETTREEKDYKTGKMVTLARPRKRLWKTLVVLRDDGLAYAERPINGLLPLSELEPPLRLPEEVQDSRGFSGAGVKKYLAGERPDPKEVFRRVMAVVDRYMDFNRSLAPQETLCEMLACYALSTYFLDAFTVMGYLWPSGDRGAGKTHCLVTICEVAYLGQVVLAGGSYATLRDLAHYGACLAFDDVETLMDSKRTDPDKRALLLAGNRRGTTVSLKEQLGTKWITRQIHAFSPRLFSAIRVPDAVLASRTILIPLVRSGDKAKTDLDPLDPDSWPSDRRELVDDLWALGLSHLTRLHEFDVEAARRALLSGRLLDPWRSIFAVALWLEEEHGVTGLFSRMEKLSLDYQEERSDLELGDPTRVAILALKQLWREGFLDPLEFETSTLAQKMNELAVELELAGGNEKDPQFTNSRKTGRLLGRLRLTRAPRSARRKRWRISYAELEALAKTYGMAGGSPSPKETNGTSGNSALEGSPLSTNGSSGTNGKTAPLEGWPEGSSGEPSGELEIVGELS